MERNPIDTFYLLDSSTVTKKTSPVITWKTLAWFANEAYHVRPAANYGFAIQEGTKRYQVWKRASTVIFAIRGTEMTDMDDIRTDVLLAAGQLKKSSMFRYLYTIFLSWKDRYPEIWLTGHSLGGTIAYEISSLTGVDCVVFNPGAHPPSVGGVMRNQTKSRADIFLIVGDVISEWAKLWPGTVHLLSATGQNAPHSMINFLS